MKRMLRMALFDHSYFWSENNDYKTFPESLFLKGRSTELNPSFAIINFNYDGLLGVLLTDAMRERCNGKNDVQQPTGEQLAAIAGGYYSLVETIKTPSGGGSVLSGTTECGELNPGEFCHLMPHGTMVEARVNNNQVVSLRDIVYGFGDRVERETRFLENYNLEPLIHFPWETDERSVMQRKQLMCARTAVAAAKRIHFIGLSGHQLLGHSLGEIFYPLRHSNQLMSMEWHIATPDNHLEVALKLAECFLQNDIEQQRKDAFLSRVRHPQVLRKYSSFDDWLSKKPHLV